MRVQEIMTSAVVSCAPDLDLSSVARLMMTHGCGTLTVVDKAKRLVGIVTDRDICMRLATCGRSAKKTFAHEAMTRDVVTSRPDEEVRVALERMATSGVRRLPVVGQGAAPVGILSIDDVVTRGQGAGLSQAEVLAALKKICEAPKVEEVALTLD